MLSLPGHEGLAHARDDFFDGDRHVLVLDWVDGIDLAQVLGSRGSPGLPASSVVRWLAQAAEAITVLHAHDVVHGDIKPANLVLDGRGRVVVVDLGSSSVPGHVGRGGTPGFRAPELSDGAVPTRANDVYGLAATAFALLTGAAPAGVLPSWHDIAPGQAAVLEAALRAGLTVDPARRPATPGEFVERLRAGWGDRVPTGVTTVLLTDVVGSTELWSRIPARMPSVLAGLQLAVDAAVEAHGGTRLGATIEGDSTVSAFASALDAVAAAVALQRSLAAPPESDELPPLRIGVATGEVVAVSGDIVGATVSRAARHPGSRRRRRDPAVRIDGRGRRHRRCPPTSSSSRSGRTPSAASTAATKSTPSSRRAWPRRPIRPAVPTRAWRRSRSTTRRSSSGAKRSSRSASPGSRRPGSSASSGDRAPASRPSPGPGSFPASTTRPC